MHEKMMVGSQRCELREGMGTPEPLVVKELVVDVSETQSLVYRSAGVYFALVARTTDPDPMTGIMARKLEFPSEIDVRAPGFNGCRVGDLEWYKHMLAAACDALIRSGVTHVPLQPMEDPPRVERAFRRARYDLI